VHDRDRILEVTDLAALADEVLGPRTGTARSPTWPCPNPNHAQTGRTPPLTVFRARNGTQRWHCHGCGAGGTAIDLLVATTTLDVRGAIEALARRSGARDQPPVRPATRRAPARPPVERRVSDPAGLDAFVEDCARRLWVPQGRAVLRWLTQTRCIPGDVLRANRIGADPGRRHQARPPGMPAAGWAVVLPVHEGDQAVFAQLRLLSNSGLRRYLNARSDLAPNPRLGLYHPAEPTGSCTLITEGVFDALSAAAAGHRGAALLGAAVPEPDDTNPSARALGGRLARLPQPLLTALDADPAGALATERLHRILAHHGITPAALHLPAGVKDLNEWMQHSPQWPQALEAELRTALACVPRRSMALGR
jgi:DNA primase